MNNVDLELMQNMSEKSLTPTNPTLTAKEFDTLFDNGEDVGSYTSDDEAVRPNQNLKRVNVDFPVWMVKSLDKEAQHLGVSRQALVKVWIADCLTRNVRQSA